MSLAPVMASVTDSPTSSVMQGDVGIKPSSLPNLFEWWSMGFNGSWTTATGANTWTGRIAGTVLAQATGARQPPVVADAAGLTVLDFDSASQHFMEATGLNLDLADDGTLFIVGRHKATPTASGRFVGLTATSNDANGLLLAAPASGSALIGFGATATLNITSSASFGTAPIVACVAFGGGAGELAYVDPATGLITRQVDAAVGAAASPITRVNVGRQDSNINFLNGQLRDVAIYPRRLSTLEIDGVLEYLAAPRRSV